MTIWLPDCDGPTDLPDVRQWLLDHWRSGSLVADYFPDHRWITDTLKAAQLWWVESDTCHVLAESAPTIPADFTLDMHGLPTPAGFAVFADDLEGTDANPMFPELGNTLQVSAILWGPMAFVTGDGQVFEGLSIGSFSRHLPSTRELDTAAAARAMPMLAAILGHVPDGADYPDRGALFTYLGRCEWRPGDRPDDVLPGDNPTTVLTDVSKAEDRRLAAALWSLTTATRITAVSEPRLPRPVARRAERKGLDPTVKVLSLGGTRSVHATPEGAPASRDWQHSWIVSPHFRWQACGPRWSERRLTLIPSYRKGDPAMPLLGADRVWRVLPPRDR